MQIYILRNGREVGPFSAETTRTLLEQGDFEPEDLAWYEGLPEWTPLQDLLNKKTEPAKERIGSAFRKPIMPVQAEETAQLPESEESAEAVEADDLPPPIPTAEPTGATESSGELASDKQKAFLGYLGIHFSPGLTKEKAAMQLNDAMEDPKYAARLAQWNVERLRLYPDLFEAEIHAKRENRAGHFFELCQTEGEEYFTGITKAHCQVLVAFLDVKFPHWDAKEPEATRDYFFPAVAEKFPQLVQKQWRNRLHYNDGPKLSAEITGKSPTSKLGSRGASPIAAVIKGLIYGGFILLNLYLVVRFVPGVAHSIGIEYSTPQPPVSMLPPPLPATAVVETIKSQPASVPANSAANSNPPDAAAQATPSAPPVGMPDAPASSPTASANPPGSTPPAAEPPVPVAPPAATTPVASAPDPSSPASFGILPPPASAPAAPMIKTNLLLTKPVEIQLTYGKMMLPVGTAVKFIARQGAFLKVNYRNSVISVPASSTDID